MDKPLALIVEDDRDIVALFRHVLDIAGYQTEMILNGRDAMNRLESFTPDIVLLDLQLPGMSGVEILRRMKEDERLANVPTVVITAYAPVADSLPVEPDLLLMKPVDITQLSNLAQRLQVTKGAMKEQTHEKLTGLYTKSFFSVRLAFSLERIKQSDFRRFGILFVDAGELNTLGKRLDKVEIGNFHRKLAAQFKSTLRPTDTMAWLPEELVLLTLIEEIPSPEAPLRIAGRVKESMRNFLDENDNGLGLRVNIGVLLCDAEYDNAEQILLDVDRARMLLKDRKYTSPAIFDKTMLQ